MTLTQLKGQLKGDGDLDIIGNNWGANVFYENDGTGVFFDASQRMPAKAERGPMFPAVADFDGDGDLDIFGANPDSPNVLYLNDGTGNFIDQSSRLPTLIGYAASVATGDVNGDGVIDILVGNGYMGQNNLLLGTGGAYFTDATHLLPQVADPTDSVSLGDVDGDGDLDALIGNTDGLALLINNGTGSLTDETHRLPTNPITVRYDYDTALTDLDGDGDKDIFVGHEGQALLFLNDGTGSYTDATHKLPQDFLSVRKITVIDLNNDGINDLMLHVSSFGDRIYLGSNDGTFIDVTETMVPYVPPFDLIGDIDGDFDVDGVRVGGPAVDVYAGLTRQISWRSVPRIGKPLTIDLYGAPGAAWQLYLSGGEGYIPYSTYGILRLDPASMVTGPGGIFDADGKASVTVMVPDNSALVGGAVYWQALVTGPLRFTNLEKTTFSNL